MLSNDETFYILKLYQREKLVDQSKVFYRKYFRRFENAVACISDADIFKHLLWKNYWKIYSIIQLMKTRKSVIDMA